MIIFIHGFADKVFPQPEKPHFALAIAFPQTTAKSIVAEADINAFGAFGANQLVAGIISITPCFAVCAIFYQIATAIVSALLVALFQYLVEIVELGLLAVALGAIACFVVGELFAQVRRVGAGDSQQLIVCIVLIGACTQVGVAEALYPIFVVVLVTKAE